MTHFRVSSLLRYLTCRLAWLAIVPGLLVFVSGCGRTTLEQLESEIATASQKIGPGTDRDQMAQHRRNVSDAVSAAYQKAGQDLRPQLLEQCSVLAAKEFRLVYGYSTIAEAEQLHFLATLGGMQEAIWPVAGEWGDSCLVFLLPDTQQQQQWLLDEAGSVSALRNWMKGLRAAHSELLRTSARAVKPAAFQEVANALLDLAIRSKTPEFCDRIISGLLEDWHDERSVIVRFLDRRLQECSDDTAVQIYERHGSGLQLSVPLAVLRRELQTAASGSDAERLIAVVDAFQQRAGESGLSSDAAVRDALVAAMQGPLTAWGTSDPATDYLVSLLDRLSTGHLQLQSDIQEQIKASFKEQFQTALETSSLRTVAGCLMRAQRLGIDAEFQRVIAEQLTAAESLESSRSRLLYAGTLPPGPARMALLQSVLRRKSLNGTLLQSAVQLPETSVEWSMVTDALRSCLPTVAVPADELFSMALTLSAESPRIILLSEAFRRQSPGLDWLRPLTKMKLSDTEVEGLQQFAAIPDGQQVPPEDLNGYVSLLRESSSAALAQLFVKRLPADVELSFGQLRQLLMPDPVPGIEEFLRAASERALESAAAEPASPEFAAALDFYSRFRGSLKLQASPALLQAVFQNSLERGDETAVADSLRELAADPRRLTTTNGGRLRDFVVTQLQKQSAEKQPVSEVTLELLEAMKQYFPDERAAISAQWQRLLLSEQPRSPLLDKHLRAAVSTGFVDEVQLAEAFLKQLRTRFESPMTAAEFGEHREMLSSIAGLFEKTAAAAPLLESERMRWATLISHRAETLTNDYAGLSELQPVLDQSSLEQLKTTTALRLLEISPLDDQESLSRDAKRYLLLKESGTAETTPAAARRLLRYATGSRNWPLAAQQLSRLRSAGQLEAEDRAIESDLQNVLFGLQLVQSWQGRRIPVNIILVINGSRQQYNFDLQLQKLTGETVSGTTSLNEMGVLGKVSGRIGDDGLQLTFSGASLNFRYADDSLSVTLNPSSLRDKYDDIEFSGMDRESRLYEAELPNGNMLFLDLPRNVVPLKPMWDDVLEYNNGGWFAPPATDENDRLYFQTASFDFRGIQGGKLTFSIANLTKRGDIVVRGDLVYMSFTNNPPSRTPVIRFLRDAELKPFRQLTIPLRSNSVNTEMLGRHYGRSRIEVRIPQGTRLLILDTDPNDDSAVSFNGMSAELPVAADLPQADVRP